MLDRASLINLRLRRQHLSPPASEEEYNKLFRMMSPVSTVFWCCPGFPPTLPLHADFSDYDYCYKLRSSRDIIKGRFQNGGIAYIFADELELYGAAYKKDSRTLSGAEIDILDLVQRDGPMTIKYIMEFTGMRAKDITPVLHKLQEKFLVFEDQADNEWDRAWYYFENEFPDINLNRYSRIEAIKTIILRFVYLYVLFNEKNIRSYYCFSVKDIKTAISELIAENRLLPCENGYILPEYANELNNNYILNKSVFALQRNDFLVKANSHILKDKYKRDEYDIKYYLLIDGEFKGAVYGFFKFTEVPLEDIFVDLPEEEAKERKDEIIAAVGRIADLSVTPLIRYQGKNIGAIH